MGKVIEEKLERGECFFCGQPADIKVGYWLALKPMALIDEEGWRTIGVCYNCNESRHVLNDNSLADTRIAY